MVNTVSTRIIAKDDATQVFNNLGASMRNNVAIGTLMGNAISGAVNLAAGAVSGLIGKFGEAADIQSSNIGTAGDFARLTGLSFEQAGDQIDSFTKRMATAAATLPGSTQLYTDLGNSISDNLTAAFKDADGAFDSAGFNETLDDITTSAGIRAANAGLQAKDAALAVSKALSGKSIAELGTLQFFEQSPAALAFLQQEAEKIGTDLKDMTAQQRAEVVRKALAVPDEVIAASATSVNGLIEGFKTTLFDPSVGLFGLMRDVDLNAEGNQTGLAAIGKVLGSIFGGGGLLAQVNGLFSKLGLKIDPMQALINGLETVDGWIQKASLFLINIKAKLTRGVDLDLGLGDIGSKIGGWLSGLLDKGLAALNNVNWAMVGASLGTLFAQIFNVGLKVVSSIDWGKVASLLLKLAIGASVAIGAMLYSIDWGALGIALLKAAGLAFIALGVVVAAAVAGVGTLGLAAFAALGLALVVGIKSLQNYWESNRKKVTDAIARFFNAIARWTAEMINKIPGVNVAVPKRLDLESGEESLANKATGLDQMGLFSAIARERRSMPSGSNIVIANDSEAIFNRQQQRGLLGAIGGNRGGLSIGSLTINAGTTTDPKQLAQSVMRELNAEWQKFNQQQMAPSF